MFSSYCTKEFGIQIKKIRRRLMLTQKNVSDSCGVNCDTLRKIEAGLVVPRYDTLEHLSAVYKFDVLECFMNHRTPNQIYSFFDQLDTLILEYNPEQLVDIDIKFSDFTHDINYDLFVNQIEIKQLRHMLQGIKLYNSNQKDKCILHFLHAIRESIPSFNFENFDRFGYTFFETRILLLISMGLSVFCKYELSTKLLLKCLHQTNFCIQQSINHKKMEIKTLYNISYNYHELNNSKDALLYSVKGIKLCNDNFLNYHLPSLLYRKGIAEYFIGSDNYLETLRQSVSLLEILGNHTLANIFRKVSLEKYKIDI